MADATIPQPLDEGERRPMTEITTPKIDPEIAAELYESKDGDRVGGWTRVTVVAGESRRWMQYHTLVIRDVGGQHYGIGYDIGRTEEQPAEFPWGGPWNKVTEPIDLVRLYPHAVTTVEYRTSPAAPAVTEEV